MQKREGLLRGTPWGSIDTVQGPETREELGHYRRYMFKKGKSSFEGNPKEIWSGIEMEAGGK